MYVAAGPVLPLLLSGYRTAEPGPGRRILDPTTGIDPEETNCILASLPAAEYERLRPQLQEVELRPGQALIEPGARLTDIWFPRRGLVSLVLTMRDGRAIETRCIGYEGMLGLPAFLGADRAPYQAIVQVPGRAVRMTTSTLIEHASTGGALHDVLLRYTHAVLQQTAQLAACNALHSIDQRCARWLLDAWDATWRDALPFTRTRTASMLGVRRASVSGALSTFERAGFVESARGELRILDGAGLEVASCECHTVIRRAFADLRAAVPGPGSA